jgi:large subunit ribosomal protein L17
MRHNNRKHKLGVSGTHRAAMMGNLMTALITHSRIETTISKARALRPVMEKIITLAKKAEKANDTARKLHYRRLAIARVRDKKAVAQLFDERVTEFTERNGGYTRIYKLGQRIGDAAEMALIEFVDGNDEGYNAKPKKKTAKKTAAKKAVKADDAEEEEAPADDADDAVEAKAEVAEAEAEVIDAKEEAAEAKEEVAEAKEDVAEAKEDVAEAKEDVAEAKEDVVAAKEAVVEAKEEAAEEKKDA